MSVKTATAESLVTLFNIKKGVLVTQNNDDAKEWYNKGLHSTELGKFNEAIASYDEALKKDPNYSVALFMKSNALFSLGLFTEAIVCYDKAIDGYDKTLEAGSLALVWRNKGIAYSSMNQYDIALECSDRALEFDPNFLDAWNDRGLFFLYLKNYDQAISCFDKAIDLDPDYAFAYRNKGLAFHELKKYSEAIKCYEKASQIGPDFAAPRADKGFTLYKLERYKDAIKCSEEALKLDPNYAPALQLKGSCLQAVGKYSEGEDNLNRAISLMLQNFENLRISEKTNLAEMLVIARRYEEGGKYAREALPETQDAGYKCILNVIILSSNILAKESTSSYLLAKDSINSTEKEFSTFVEEYKNLDECFECKEYWDFSELIRAINRVANLQTKFLLLSIIDLLQGNIDKHKLSFFGST